MYTYIRTYTATLALAGTAAGTVQFGNTIDPTGTPPSTGGVPVNGQLMAIQLQFVPPMTSGTFSVATAGEGGPGQSMLTYVGGTSQWFYPRIQDVNSSGVNLGTTIVDRYPIDDMVTLVGVGGSVGTVIAKMKVYQGG